MPVCVAKTLVSFSADDGQRRAQTAFTLTIREIRPAINAGFLVAICGEMTTMPGLLRVPGATWISLDRNGLIAG